MKKLFICTLSLLTIGFGLHFERISLDSSDPVVLSEAEARGGGGRGGGGRGGGGARSHHGGHRGHTSVHASPRHHRPPVHRPPVHRPPVHRGPTVGGALVAGAAIATTAAIIGSRHARLPNSCTNYDYLGRPYYNCAGVYYQPVYSGPEVIYIVVDKP